MRRFRFARAPFGLPVVLALVGSLCACFSSSSASPDAGMAFDSSTTFEASAAEDGTAPPQDAATPDAHIDAPPPSMDAGIDAAAIDAGMDAAVMEAGLPGAVYASAGATGNVFVFSLGDGGFLSAQMTGSPFATGGGNSNCITGNAAGTRLYAGTESAAGVPSLASFTLDSNANISGTQSGSPFATGASGTPTRVVLNPAGTRLYVVHQGASGGSIAVFAIAANGDVGALRPGSPYNTGGGTYAASVNPAGTRLYVTSQERRAVLVYTLDANGDIGAEASGSPFSTGLSDAPILSVVHPSGSRLYVTDQQNDLVVFVLDANGDITGQATGSPFASTNTYGVTVNAAGTRLYVGTNSSTLDIFTLDKTTGDVSGAAATFAVGIATYDMAIDLSQRNLYVVDYNNNAIAALALDANGDPQVAKPGMLPDAATYPSAVYAR